LKDYQRIAKKITTTLFAAQSLGSAGFIVTSAVSAIVGAQLSGDPALAGAPSALLQIGSALTALAMGLITDRFGRRRGFTFGLLVGVLGAGIASTAIILEMFFLFLGGTFLMGVAQATIQLGRFAAAEVHPLERRGQAISNVVVGGTVGSIVGPVLVGPAGKWAMTFGLNELAGPYLIALIIFLLVTLTVFVFLRPDPRDIGIEIAKIQAEKTPQSGTTRSPLQIFRTPAAFLAVLAMVIGQVVMVMLMGITSLHMKNQAHSLTNISIVFSSHTFGMFATSLISGRLVDRWGRGWVIVMGAGILIFAGLFAPLSANILPLALALFLLGLGWNFCYVGGSTLLSDQLSPVERAKTQGANDLLIGLATAVASISSGILYANTSYATLGLLGALLAAIPLGLAGWLMFQKQLLNPPSKN